MKQLLIGIDVGSTTTKITVLDKTTESLLYSDYRRHHADQLASVLFAIRQAAEKFPDTKARIILTGSGAKPVAEAADTPYIQEVVANSIALKKTYETVGTAIELGGQDAKIIFFKTDSKTGALNVADMRMNGSCAGGTGAFIDEVASILQTPPEKMNELACKGTCVYDISGRCGVYAKTDIQPLLNQGVAKADIALSSFHAIAKQTIGGLAQGLDIKPPVVFEGGPLTFNPKLIDVFSERLNLKENERLVPEHPEIMVAYGAALSLNGMFKEADPEASDAPVTFLPLTEWVSLLEQVQEDTKKKQHSGQEHAAPLFFSSKEEHDTFLKEHPKGDFTPAALTPGTTIRAWLGIDSGSTTTKFVLMGDDGKLLDFFYASNQGDPLTVAKNALITMRNRYRDAGVTLEILGCGSTGYGELLFSRAFSTEYHVVETVAHARAAFQYMPDITFLLDIGGQLARPRHHHEHSRQRGMFLRLRFLPGKLRFHVEDPGDGDRRRRLFLEKSGDPRQPLYRLHEQQHRHRAEKREKAGRYHGRPLPFYHRECLHEGHPDLEPRLSRGSHHGPGRNLPE